jgi:hypothetical protein
MASWAASHQPTSESPPCDRAACAASRPISTRLEPASDLRGFAAGSSRTPSRLACRTRAVWWYRPVPSLSGLLPPFPAPPRSGCPQLHQPAATGRGQSPFTSTRLRGASRRAEIFCCNPTMRRSRSAWLLSNGTRRSPRNPSTSTRWRPALTAASGRGPRAGRGRCACIDADARARRCASARLARTRGGKREVPTWLAPAPGPSRT